MRTRSIIAALLLLVAGLQTSWAQGFRVYKSDGTVAQFSMRADSIVFYDGIGSDMDFGPYTPVNQCIAGTWYETYDKSITFGEDGTTDYIAGATYKFLPYQGTVIFYNAAGNPISLLKVHDLTANQMVMSVFGSDVFHVMTKTQPALPVSVSCAQAVELTNALEDGATSEETYSVTGYITEVVGNVSRNQQIFWMADTKDGGPVFEAYWANLPEGVAEFKAGMKVTITGKLTKYVNSAGNVFCEMKNADVVILEDAGEDVPVETGITCAKAVELTNALEDGATSEETYSVTGYITEVVGNVSRNQQTFWMADTKDGGKVFEAYWANLPEGVAEFTVGMKVTITGQLMKYVRNEVVTPEIKNAEVVILENGDGGQGGIQHVSIAEFLAKADASTAYELTGTVRNITNTTYGNFYLFEGNDSIYIYGLLDQNGESRNFANLGIAEGDVVTLTGTYFLYNDLPEIKNAQFVSVVKSGDNPDPNPGPGDDTLSDLVNGGFETWLGDTIPTGWKSASTASSAVLRKSTDAHNGTYACLVATGGTQNKRLATQEITLEAGTYTFSFYAKSTTDEVCQTRAGYVPVTDGAVGSYKYGDFVNISNTEWTLVTYSFDLTQQTTLCLLVMNPKGSSYSVSQDILVDDAELRKE